MSDHSIDQVNGRSLVEAFAICEQRLNTVMVLRESAEINGGRFDGAVLCTELRIAVKATAKQKTSAFSFESRSTRSYLKPCRALSGKTAAQNLRDSAIKQPRQLPFDPLNERGEKLICVERSIGCSPSARIH